MGSRGTAAVYETNRSGRADNKVLQNFLPAGHLSEAVPLTIQSVVTKFGQCWNAANEESGVISSM
jgi:hypothetical protein